MPPRSSISTGFDATSLAQALCQRLGPAFTEPTFGTFLHIVTGWVLCRSRPTVTNLVCTIGQSLLGQTAKHWTTYERFFYRAVWDLEVLCRLLRREVVVPLIETGSLERRIDLAIDDTPCGRYGKHVAFAGYFKDASASHTKAKVVHWAHNWVIGAIMLRAKRWPNWVIGLPVWFTLYRKRPDGSKRQLFATRSQIAAVMIRQIRNLLPDWLLRVVVDGQYATHEVAQAVGAIGSNLVWRIRSDAAIYALLPKAKAGRRGPPRKKGKRLPCPRQIAARCKMGWQLIEARMYGQPRQRRAVR